MTRLTMVLAALALATGCTTAASQPEESAELSAAIERAPTALSGDFQFKGTVKALHRLTVDVVDMRMTGAAARLAGLRAGGATCQLVLSNVHRCTQMHDAGQVADTSLAAIGARNKGAFASFGAVTASPSIVSEGESLIEWDIAQKGETLGGDFTHYRYLAIAPDLTKIVLPGDNGTLELIVKDGEHLAKWESSTVHEGQWRWHQDAAFVILEK